MLFEEMLTVQRWFDRKNKVEASQKAGPYRVYVKSPSEVPEGRIVHRGEQGGMYYETDQAPAAQEKEPAEQKPQAGQATLDLFPGVTEEPEAKAPEPKKKRETKAKAPADMPRNELEVELMTMGERMQDLLKLLRKKSGYMESVNRGYSYSADIKRMAEILQTLSTAGRGNKKIISLLHEALDMDKNRNVEMDASTLSIIYPTETTNKVMAFVSILKLSNIFIDIAPVKVGGRSGGRSRIEGLAINRQNISDLETFVDMVHSAHTTPIDGDIYRMTSKGRDKLESIMKMWGGDISEVEELLTRISPLLEVYYKDPQLINLNVYLNMCDLDYYTGGTHIGTSNSININQAQHPKRVKEKPFAVGTQQERNAKIMEESLKVEKDLDYHGAKPSIDRQRFRVVDSVLEALHRVEAGPGGHSQGMLHTIAHELGHVVAGMDKTLPFQLETVPGSDYVTQYGHVYGRYESWAEAFGTYFTNPQWLERFRPEVYQYFKRFEEEQKATLDKKRAVM